ncbi:MAG: hypothetical protein ABIQ89_01685 [Candidatus Saccharimonadales bacterium]
MANISLKRVQISKANTTMVIATAGAAFIVTFSIIAGKALVSKQAYQSRIIGGKEKAVNQLQANIKATNTLVTSYKAFVGTSSNVIGGNPAGTGDKDGDNAKIILDALPSQYDFPALASSLEKIMQGNGFKINTISGADDEIAQQTIDDTKSPAPVPMPFDLSITTNLGGTKDLLSLLERSIRPIKVQTVNISGNNSELTVNISAETYYQPQKTLTIRTEVVK